MAAFQQKQCLLYLPLVDVKSEDTFQYEERTLIYVGSKDTFLSKHLKFSRRKTEGCVPMRSTDTGEVEGLVVF